MVTPPVIIFGIVHSFCELTVCDIPLHGCYGQVSCSSNEKHKKRKKLVKCNMVIKSLAVAMPFTAHLCSYYMHVSCLTFVSVNAHVRCVVSAECLRVYGCYFEEKVCALRQWRYRMRSRNQLSVLENSGTFSCRARWTRARVPAPATAFRCVQECKNARVCLTEDSKWS